MSSDARNLPQDVEALHALIAAERAEHAALQAILTARDIALASKQTEIEHLKMVLAKLRRSRFEIGRAHV